MERFEQSLIGNNPEKDKKEVVFMTEIIDRLTSNLVKELESLNYSAEDLAQFSVDVKNDPDQDHLSRLLAIPKELRLNIFTKNKLSGHNFSIMEVLNNFYDSFVKSNNGELPKIGFHTSDKDILPKTVKDKFNPEGKLVWDIDGTELSDLSDGKQAYASDSYKSIYRERSPQWLYLVRLMDEKNRYGEDETSWHHNNNFAIIDRFKLEDIDQGVLQRLNNPINDQTKEFDLKSAA